MRFDRRGFLALSLMALQGCAGTIYGRSAEPDLATRRRGPSRLRIAIFEIEALDFPFHTGVVIHSPEGRFIYDPAGYWKEDGAQRYRDLWYDITPELEEAYLRRSSVTLGEGAWSTHLFEAEVSHETARLAVEIGRERESMVFGACSFGLSSLLQELPGFEDIRPTWVPGALLTQLHARNDLQYSFRAPTGAAA